MIERKLIEKNVNCTKRTQVFAERSPDDHAQQNNEWAEIIEEQL